ncbi:hypothetical protein CF328_g8885, partial [Tilletia controversa]
MRADRPHNRSHLATSGRLLPSLPGDFGSALVSSPSVVASPDSVTLATILTTLQDLLRRSAGRLDTVEDRVASLETRLAGIKGLLPAHRRDSTSGMEPSAASTTVTAFETTTQPPVSTSAPAIFTLAITRTPPLHVLLPASSTAPSPPWGRRSASAPARVSSAELGHPDTASPFGLASYSGGQEDPDAENGYGCLLSSRGVVSALSTWNGWPGIGLFRHDQDHIKHTLQAAHVCTRIWLEQTMAVGTAVVYPTRFPHRSTVHYHTGGMAFDELNWLAYREVDLMALDPSTPALSLHPS